MSPTAAPRHWPYREHRNMAEVMRDGVLDPDDVAQSLSWSEGIARVCPRCGAPPGSRCKTISGGQYDSLHSARRVG